MNALRKALILVDIQNDFLPGGALAVPGGDQIIPIVNHLIDEFQCVVATQDWHPAHHGSFASNHRGPGTEVGSWIELAGLSQILWPDHCIQNTFGARLADGIRREAIDETFPKGTNPEIDSYSGFFDNARRQSTGLEAYLRQAGVAEVHVVGLATDYCVKFTALDSADLGFETYVHRNAVRGVELNAGDCEAAFAAMSLAGVSIVED